MKHSILLLLVISCVYLTVYAQESNAKNPKEEITIKKDRFLKKTNWITLGWGYAQKLNSFEACFPGSLNAYFHVKQVYLTQLTAALSILSHCAITPNLRGRSECLPDKIKSTLKPQELENAEKLAGDKSAEVLAQEIMK